MAEPGQLALGIVAGRLLEFFRAGFQWSRLLKIREELLVADGLRCRAEAFPVLPDMLRFLYKARFGGRDSACCSLSVLPVAR